MGCHLGRILAPWRDSHSSASSCRNCPSSVGQLRPVAAKSPVRRSSSRLIPKLACGDLCPSGSYRGKRLRASLRFGARLRRGLDFSKMAGGLIKAGNREQGTGSRKRVPIRLRPGMPGLRSGQAFDSDRAKGRGKSKSKSNRRSFDSSRRAGTRSG